VTTEVGTLARVPAFAATNQSGAGITASDGTPQGVPSTRGASGYLYGRIAERDGYDQSYRRGHCAGVHGKWNRRQLHGDGESRDYHDQPRVRFGEHELMFVKT